jgi:hypothetical protein
MFSYVRKTMRKPLPIAPRKPDGGLYPVSFVPWAVRTGNSPDRPNNSPVNPRSPYSNPPMTPRLHVSSVLSSNEAGKLMRIRPRYRVGFLGEILRERSINYGHVWFLATLCQAKVWLPQFSWYVFGFLPHFGYKYFILSVAHLS